MDNNTNGPEMFIPSPGVVVKIVENNKEALALALWKRWIDENDGDPIYASSHALYCFFCGTFQPSMKNDNNHAEDCIYLKVKELFTHA